MNKKTGHVIITALALTLSLSMLSGCGGGGSSESAAAATTAATTEAAPATQAASDDYIDLSGDWDNDDLEATLTLYDDGTLVIYQTGSVAEGSYEWDGEQFISITLEGTSLEGEDETYEGMLDEEGDLVFDEIDGWFYYVDSGAYTSDPEEYDDSDSSGSFIEIENTEWSVDGNYYAFFEDGIFAVHDSSDIMVGTYVWQGDTGMVDLQGTTTNIMLDGEDLCILGEDGSYYRMTLVGEPDPSVYFPNDVDDSELEANDYDFEEDSDYMAGAYDNDDMEMSLIFYPDGTVYVHNDGEEYEATYELYPDGSLDLIFNGTLDEGYIYDSDSDTITEPSFGTTYYSVSEAGY